MNNARPRHRVVVWLDEAQSSATLTMRPTLQALHYAGLLVSSSENEPSADPVPSVKTCHEACQGSNGQES